MIVTKPPKQGLHFEMFVSPFCDYFSWKKESNLNSVPSRLYYHSWTQLPLVQKEKKAWTILTLPSHVAPRQSPSATPPCLLLIPAGDAGLYLKIADWDKEQWQAAVLCWNPEMITWNTGEHFWISAAAAITLRHQKPVVQLPWGKMFFCTTFLYHVSRTSIILLSAFFQQKTAL